MKCMVIAFSVLLLVAAVMAGEKWHGGWHQEPKVIKIIKPVQVVKIVKHIPPPVPVIKYIKFFHHTTVGHPSIHHGGGWW